MSISVKTGKVFQLKMKSKKASIINKVIIHVILVGLIFAIFLTAVAGKINGRDVKQQVLEKQIALLIDSAESGMSFEIIKSNINGFVSDVKIKNGKVFITIDGFSSYKGYPYFSKYSVGVEKFDDKFVVSVK